LGIAAVTGNADSAERGAVSTNKASDGANNASEVADNCLPSFTVVRCSRLAALHFTNIALVTGPTGRSSRDEDSGDGDGEDSELGEHYERM